MTDKKEETPSQKPQDAAPKGTEGQSPKASKADNDVVKSQGGDKDVVGEKVAQSAQAPKEAEKNSAKAAGPRYSLVTFTHISDLAADQLHAFERWAEQEVDSDQTLSEWKKLLQDFLSRPV